MEDGLQTSATPLAQVPAHQRRRVLSGMRWTVWLSVLAVPFSAGTNFLLARVGPETIGVYGLLSVYVAAISAFIYFGGNTVVIRFIPECRREERASFLLSYLLIIACSVVFWLVLAHLSPDGVRLILGPGRGDRFNFAIVCLAPVPIAFWLITASLQGMLEIRFAQTLSKLLTVVSLVIYSVVFFAARPLLTKYPAEVIWSVYFLLMAALGLVGAVSLVRLCGTPRLRFYLPCGFWRYAFSTQQVAMMNFLTRRLDYLLVINFAGLQMLGRYVAVMAVAGLVPMINGFFMETLLPSLTNMIATRNHAGAGELFKMHMRILFLVATGTSCAIMVLAPLATAAMGANYQSIQSLIVIMAMIQGMATPGGFGSTVLSSVGRQQRALWSGVVHSVLLSALFFLTWHRWRLTGAVIALGVAMLASNATLMTIALRTARIYPSISGLWLRASLVDAAVGLISLWWRPLGPVASALTWIGAMMLLLRLGEYGAAECRTLAQTLVPATALRIGKRPDPFVVEPGPAWPR